MTTKAFNLAQLANFVNSGGQLDASSLTGSSPNADHATTADSATNSTNATILKTTNFTIQESGGKLVFKFGTTVIASMDSAGNITSSTNVTGYGTP